MSDRIKCFACDLEYYSNESLLKHIELVHSSLKSYKCSEADCHRNFELFKSYKKHRKSKHVAKQPDEILSTVMLEEMQINSKMLIDTEASALDNLLMEIDNSDEDDDISDSEDEMESFQNPIDSMKSTFYSNVSPSKTVGKEQLLFVSKLHKHPDISRKRVDEIIQNTSELLQSTITVVNNEIHNLFATYPKSSNTLTNIDKILDKFSNPFNNLKTEAQRFAEFKNAETLKKFWNYLLFLIK